MTQDEQTVLMIKGAISELSRDQRMIVEKYYQSIKEAVTREPAVAFAVALIGAELACND